MFHFETKQRRLVLAAGLASFACVPPSSTDPIEVSIPHGATMAVAAESLAARGVVRSAEAFQAYARLAGEPDTVLGGVYYLQAGPPGRVLPVLMQGPTVGRFEVREGAMLREVAATVEEALGVPAEALLAAAADSALRARIGARGPHLEGYLYPTTYYVPLDATPAELVETMIEEFERRWRSEWTGRARAIGWSRDELVTLASIVAGETRLPEERPIVASVYRNRLEAGMRLQADPTVIYALGERRRLRNRDYRIDSPYNTYRIDGLPPGPVGQPTTESIEAVLDPADTDYLYFLAGPEGAHLFSETYDEHLSAIRERQRQRRRRP